MTPRARLLVFIGACACVLPAAVDVVMHMPAFGVHPLPYGDAVNRLGTAERHVTNMVSLVNFDVRGFDTLGEEFMLLCAVTGVTILLRGARGEQPTAEPGYAPGRPDVRRSAAVTAIGRVFAPLIVLFGFYVVLHAMTTPGGGFQGGVIMASGCLLIWMGDGYRSWRQMMRTEILDAAEGFGASLYAAAGLAPMVLGLPFLTNILPFGQPKDLLSGGLMLVLNAGVGFAVAGGFGVLFVEFLEETRAVPLGGGE
ncbi:MAG TPA: MnhB domain-containing protein [Rhodopila sp.]|uniref:MnhB domain-containing protein n=1 Tax=Rhodopila sp. TaxID=2480087 RepID=UPI002C7E8D05|nr:MnhB domain-containing protein [Rhodopila sp.]HVY13978.1 MnhB domain-containing protein [Rhodopila sp.]